MTQIEKMLDELKRKKKEKRVLPGLRSSFFRKFIWSGSPERFQVEIQFSYAMKEANNNAKHTMTHGKWNWKMTFREWAKKDRQKTTKQQQNVKKRSSHRHWIDWKVFNSLTSVSSTEKQCRRQAFACTSCCMFSLFTAYVFCT